MAYYARHVIQIDLTLGASAALSEAVDEFEDVWKVEYTAYVDVMRHVAQPVLVAVVTCGPYFEDEGEQPEEDHARGPVAYDDSPITFD